MVIRDKFLAILLGLCVSACTTVDLPEVDFMGQSDFEDELADLDPTFPNISETPDLPTDVRTDAQWDESARNMQSLFGSTDTPAAEPALSEDEFNRQFNAARSATEEYKKDDPQ